MTAMWLFVGQVIWFFFPAGVANMAASLSRYLPVSAAPIDGGKTWRGKRIFGAHKTWRGALVGIIAGTLFWWLQAWLYREYIWAVDISTIDYLAEPWTMGLLLAIGAVVGDLVKSFFKRRVNRPPGAPWVPFDQMDYVVGGALFVSLTVVPSWAYIVTAIGLGVLFHIIINLTAYTLRLQKNKL